MIILYKLQQQQQQQKEPEQHDKVQLNCIVFDFTFQIAMKSNCMSEVIITFVSNWLTWNENYGRRPRDESKTTTTTKQIH